jgi:hypothetical protein
MNIQRQGETGISRTHPCVFAPSNGRNELCCAPGRNRAARKTISKSVPGDPGVLAFELLWAISSA